MRWTKVGEAWNKCTLNNVWKTLYKMQQSLACISCFRVTNAEALKTPLPQQKNSATATRNLHLQSGNGNNILPGYDLGLCPIGADHNHRTSPIRLLNLQSLAGQYVSVFEKGLSRSAVPIFITVNKVCAICSKWGMGSFAPNRACKESNQNNSRAF